MPVECNVCGESKRRKDMQKIKKNYYCPNCIPDYLKCDSCNKKFEVSLLKNKGASMYCEDCIQSKKKRKSTSKSKAEATETKENLDANSNESAGKVIEPDSNINNLNAADNSKLEQDVVQLNKRIESLSKVVDLKEKQLNEKDEMLKEAEKINSDLAKQLDRIKSRDYDNDLSNRLKKSSNTVRLMMEQIDKLNKELERSMGIVANKSIQIYEMHQKCVSLLKRQIVSGNKDAKIEKDQEVDDEDNDKIKIIVLEEKLAKLQSELVEWVNKYNELESKNLVLGTLLSSNKEDSSEVLEDEEQEEEESEQVEESKPKEAPTTARKKKRRGSSSEEDSDETKEAVDGGMKEGDSSTKEKGWLSGWFNT